MACSSTAGATLRRVADAQYLARATRRTDTLTPDQQRDIGIAFHSAMAALTAGTAHEGDIHTLAFSVNVSLLLCELDIGAEHIDAVRLAQDALVTLRARRVRHPGMTHWVLSAQEMGRLNAVLELLDAQLAEPSCTEGVMARVLAEIAERVKAGHVMEEAAA